MAGTKGVDGDIDEGVDTLTVGPANVTGHAEPALVVCGVEEETGRCVGADGRDTLNDQ